MLRRLYGSWVMVSHLPGQAKIPFLPQSKRAAKRDENVRKIVAYALKNVPFYREYSSERKLSASDIASASDLALLPIIGRSAVKRDSLRYRSTNRQGKRAIEFRTGGTTGEPVTIWHDRRSLLLQASFGARERSVISEILGRGIGYKILHIDNPRGFLPLIFSFYKESAFTPIKPSRRFLPISSPLSEIVQALEEFSPDVLISYGSYVEHLVQRIVQSGLDVKWPKLIRFGGDSLSPGARQLLMDRFRVPSISNYGTMECLKIGFECGRGGGFHLHEDLCHVRIMNPDGTEARLGEKGEVIISNLVNRGTVLLNYRLGDVAAITDGKCPCGRTGLRLTELDGRVEDIIFLRDGHFVHPRAIWALFRSEPLIQYQLIQNSYDEFELKLVSSGQELFDAVAARIVRKLKSVLGADVKIVCTRHGSPIRPTVGKFRTVMSSCSRPGLSTKSEEFGL